MSQPTITTRRGPYARPKARTRSEPDERRADEKRLTELARLAKNGTAAERNALFFAYQPVLERKAASLWRRYGRSRAVELDDLKQESFIVFVDVLSAWHGSGSFSQYLLGTFWWRMRDSVNRLGLGVPDSPGADRFVDLHDGSAGAEDALSLLDQLAADLPPLERQLLLWRVRDGHSVRSIALELRIDRRSVQRAWNRATRTLRGSLLR